MLITSTFNDYGQYSDIRRVDSRYARCLKKGFRLEFLEFFAAFIAQSIALVIVQPARYLQFFVIFCPFSSLYLLFYIWCIMTHNA